MFVDSEIICDWYVIFKRQENVADGVVNNLEHISKHATNFIVAGAYLQDV